MKVPVLFLSLAIVAGGAVQAQVPGQEAAAQAGGSSWQRAVVPIASAEGASVDYRIGADDEVAVSVLQAPDLATTARVSEQGLVSLPLIGQVQAAGLTVAEFERVIADRLRATYMKDPQVTVRVTDVRSRAVSVMGAVQRPGILQVRTVATLLGVLSLAGGLAPEAGDTVVVLHQGASAPIEVPLKPLMESRDVKLNLPIYPGDIVNVRPADVVYVVGAVNKPGAFAMRGNDRLTVLRALALGEGLAPTAAKKKVLVVRTAQSGERSEIHVDLASLLKGKHPDVTLQAQDVLFVPTSGGKVVARGTLDAMVRILTWRPY